MKKPDTPANKPASKKSTAKPKASAQPPQPEATDMRLRVTSWRKAKVSELQANPRNWRNHPDNQRRALHAIMKRVGFVGAVLSYLEDGAEVLLDGHLRIEEMQPEQEVWVGQTDLTRAEADYLLTVFDPLTALAVADADALTELLASFTDADADLQALVASVAEQAGVDFPLLEDVPPVIGDAPEPEELVERAAVLQKKWKVKPGDLWALGEHRLLCGDCGVEADVKRVMDGGRADLVFTDPPYGVSVGAKNRLLNTFQKAGRCLADVVSDDATEAELYAILLNAFTLTREIACSDSCSVLVCSPQGCGLGMMMMMMMQESGLRARHVLIWAKNQPTFSMGRLDYDYQHEPILFTWTKRHKCYHRGAFQTSVWEVDKPRASKEHPTMKPVELPINAIMNHTDEGDLVYDPFSGSGTTLIACEQTGRKCRAIEIEPKYCAVTLERWSLATGGKPERVK